MPFLVTLILAIIAILVVIPESILNVLKLMEKWKHKNDE